MSIDPPLAVPPPPAPWQVPSVQPSIGVQGVFSHGFELKVVVVVVVVVVVAVVVVAVELL